MGKENKEITGLCLICLYFSCFTGNYKIIFFNVVPNFKEFTKIKNKKILDASLDPDESRKWEEIDSEELHQVQELKSYSQKLLSNMTVVDTTET